MGDLEFCRNESGKFEKKISTLFSTRLLPPKKFFETIQFFLWRPGFFKKRVHFSKTSYLCGAVVDISFCGKKSFLIFFIDNLVYGSAKNIQGATAVAPTRKINMS